MTRITYAGDRLSKQVVALRPDAEIIAGEPDGLGVRRTLTFDSVTGEWLGPLLEEIADKRIASLDLNDDGLDVTFVSGIKADTRDPFPLEEADTVVNGIKGADDTDGQFKPEEIEEAIEKKPAKKAASKKP